MNIYIPILLSLLLALALAEDCHPGFYKMKKGVCRACPKGTFQSKKSKYACRPCPLNSISKAGSVACKECPEGSYPNKFQGRCYCGPGYHKINGKCVICKAGKYSEGGRFAYCNGCTAGMYQPKRGQSECLTCPPDTFSGFGAKECFTCAEDEEFNRSTEKCEKSGECKAGYYLDKYSGCKKCEMNRYKPNPGSGPCLPCPVNTHSNPGATFCKPCPPGTVIFSNGECGSCEAGSFWSKYDQKCLLCGLNQFTPYKNTKTSCYSCSSKEFALRGSTKCVSCPKHTFLNEKGECEECPLGSIYMRNDLICHKCEANQFSGGDMDYCEDCPSGTYSLPGATTCFTCPDGEALILNIKACGKCPPGKRYDKYSSTCEKCYNGSIKPEAGIGDCENCKSHISNDDRTECIDE